LIDKLVLTGGQDISPWLYDEEAHPALGKICPKRDAFELTLIAEMQKLGKPILGVCRGMQLLNVAFGGSLYQDLASQFDGLVIKHLQAPIHESIASHSIELVEGTIFSEIYPKGHRVTSFHHQAVKRLAPTFKATAYSPEQLVEAFMGNHIMAVQWHPEMNYFNAPEEVKLFDYFVNTFN